MANDMKRCRICLRQRSVRFRMHPIPEKSSVAIEIFLCTRIKIDLPAIICSTCTNDLKVATRFRLNAVKADVFYKKEMTKDSKIVEIKKEQQESSIKLQLDGFEKVDVDSFQDTETVAEVATRTEDKRVKKRKKVDDLDEVDVQCRQCNKSFKKSYIKRHINRAHSDRQQHQSKPKPAFTNDNDSDSLLYCEVGNAA
jgi:hypothetical protein